MAKVQKITISNLKAIGEFAADFKGCTAIVTGGNNKGKSTLLRSLPDRIHGITPGVILKQGTKEGMTEWALTTGERLVWSFEEKPNRKGENTFYEKLIYITKDNIKGSLTRELCLRYFPPVFDVDEFLTSQPKIQRAKLQKLVGLDFTDIDSRYQKAYEEREGKNRRALEEKIHFEKMTMPEQVQPVSIEDLKKRKDDIRADLNQLYLSNKAHNEKLRNDYLAEVERILREHNESVEATRKEVDDYNKVNEELRDRYTRAKGFQEALQALGFDGEDLKAFIYELLGGLREDKTYPVTVEPSLPIEPTYVKEMPDNGPLLRIEEEINKAIETNHQAEEWVKWDNQRKEMLATKEEAEEANRKVVAIEFEKMEMIRNAKLPEGFGFDDDGITYNGLPFTKEQLSSSGIYIAALKLASMTLGEVRTLHFDASFLDKKSLLDIEAWAQKEDLQLLIERPDFEGGEIEYQLICEQAK